MISKYIKYIFNESSDEDPLKSCIEQIFDYLFASGMTLKNILFVTIFVDEIERFKEFSVEIERSLFKLNFDIPHIIVPQKPNMAKIAFELIFIEGNFELINFNENYRVIERAGLIELYTAKSVYSSQIYESSGIVFNDIFQYLKRFKFRKGHIVRQWNYIENIFLEDSLAQNYQTFNEVRSAFYQQDTWDYGYPAATGIGTNKGGIGIALIAVKITDDVDIYPLKNPEQIDAHNYSDRVLISSYQEKSTPKFERGKIVINKKNIDIYISGTAAIKGEETIMDSTIENQTKATLDNIFKLISKKNLFDCLPEKHHRRIENIDIKRCFSNIRVYVKNQSDIESAEIICREAFGNIPLIMLQADICRENLLVEIEGNIFI